MYVVGLNGSAGGRRRSKTTHDALMSSRLTLLSRWQVRVVRHDHITSSSSSRCLLLAPRKLLSCGSVVRGIRTLQSEDTSTSGLLVMFLYQRLKFDTTSIRYCIGQCACLLFTHSTTISYQDIFDISRFSKEVTSVSVIWSINITINHLQARFYRKLWNNCWLIV